MQNKELCQLLHLNSATSQRPKRKEQVWQAILLLSCDLITFIGFVTIILVLLPQYCANKNFLSKLNLVLKKLNKNTHDKTKSMF